MKSASRSTKPTSIFQREQSAGWCCLLRQDWTPCGIPDGFGNHVHPNLSAVRLSPAAVGHLTCDSRAAVTWGAVAVGVEAGQGRRPFP
jgi:hypothetical protein